MYETSSRNSHYPSLSLSLSLSLLDVCVQLLSYFYSNQLSGTIPSTIGSLINLQQLYDMPSHSPY